ncbi:helix-turn-helix domain-containing protein [Hymenobacter sp. 5317J-9]|uniref:helix-turn-helix domain-containing protein n=1 Tax=Hymenobacter sp. 5317J-9 TaxID=2932250 RepID=UPI001FD63D2D|nr:helix-turn-helix transcriptional regulator [Hymenobacter sp. 5317J-9]UOQ96106.1 helix-turn-helix domain-containing protein [Hymenobacter sp. 5317J-9]
MAVVIHRGQEAALCETKVNQSPLDDTFVNNEIVGWSSKNKLSVLTFVINCFVSVMVERIRTLLEVRQLTPTQFADAIGVARPIVSHILSGRNKPSLEVVQRILTAMPDLSMPWLLIGTGAMLAATTSAPTPQPMVAPTQVSAPQAPAPAPPKHSEPTQVVAQEPDPEVISIHKPETGPALPRQAPKPPVEAPMPKRFAPAQKSAIAPVAATSDEPANSAAPVPVAAPAALPEPAEPSGPGMATQLLANSEKPIRRIVIFYRDGSFADYQPE